MSLEKLCCECDISHSGTGTRGPGELKITEITNAVSTLLLNLHYSPSRHTSVTYSETCLLWSPL